MKSPSSIELFSCLIICLNSTSFDFEEEDDDIYCSKVPLSPLFESLFNNLKLLSIKSVELNISVSLKSSSFSLSDSISYIFYSIFEEYNLGDIFGIINFIISLI